MFDKIPRREKFSPHLRRNTSAVGEHTHTFNSTQFSFIHIEPNYNDCHLKVQRLLSNQEKAFKNSRQQISCCEICFQSFSVHFNLLSFL